MEREIITSRQNPLVKFVCGLTEKKLRNKEGLFRFDGIKLLSEALAANLDIKYIVYRAPASKRVEELIFQAKSAGKIGDGGAVAVSDSVFEKISEERSPEGVITVAFMPEIHGRYGEVTLGREEKLLIVESLRDPGNLGTVIRSCYALGIDRLILTDDCADIYNGKTVRAAMGAIFRQQTLTVSATELSGFIKELREGGRSVYATALSESSRNIGDVGLRSGDCFVIGNEGHGLTSETVSACTAPVIIPMREDAESLNAAAAAAICIWETVRAE